MGHDLFHFILKNKNQTVKIPFLGISCASGLGGSDGIGRFKFIKTALFVFVVYLRGGA
jgi:hypothetical protein